MSWPYTPATEKARKSASGSSACLTTWASGQTRFRAFSNSFVAVRGSVSAARQAGLYICAYTTLRAATQGMLAHAQQEAYHLAEASCADTVRVDSSRTGPDAPVIDMSSHDTMLQAFDHTSYWGRHTSQRSVELRPVAVEAVLHVLGVFIGRR